MNLLIKTQYIKRKVLKKNIKTFKKFLLESDITPSKSMAEFRLIQSKVGKAVARGTIPKNKRNRILSMLQNSGFSYLSQYANQDEMLRNKSGNSKPIT